MGKIRQWAREHKRNALVLAVAAVAVLAATGGALGYALASGPAPSVTACAAAMRQADLGFEKTGKPLLSDGTTLQTACRGIPDAQVRQIAFQVGSSVADGGR